MGRIRDGLVKALEGGLPVEMFPELAQCVVSRATRLFVASYLKLKLKNLY